MVVLTCLTNMTSANEPNNVVLEVGPSKAFNNVPGGSKHPAVCRLVMAVYENNCALSRQHDEFVHAIRVALSQPPPSIEELSSKVNGRTVL